MRSPVRKLHHLQSWGTGDYFLSEGNILVRLSQNVTCSRKKKKEKDKWNNAPVLVANTFG